MMDFQRIAEIAGGLAALKFFPVDDHARLAIMEMIGDMAENEDQVQWLVKRMLSLFNEWPGPKELRALFCSRWTPRDGLLAYTEVYTFLNGGYPNPANPPKEPRALPEPRALLASSDATPICAESQAVIDELVQAMPRMPAAVPIGDALEARLREVLMGPIDRPQPPAPTPQIITETDVQRAVEQLHAKRLNGGA
jgi:hypothetical protein